MTALLLGVHWCCLEDYSGCCRRWCIQVWFNQLYAPRPCSAEAAGRVQASSGGTRKNAEAPDEGDGVWVSFHYSGSTGWSLRFWMGRLWILMLRIFPIPPPGEYFRRDVWQRSPNPQAADQYRSAGYLVLGRPKTINNVQTYNTLFLLLSETEWWFILKNYGSLSMHIYYFNI